MANKVLMIDDDPEFVDAMSDLLVAKGYEVHTALNGKEGIEKARTEDPDVILLDVVMATKHEGFDIARELHGDQTLKTTPIIILTGIRQEMNLPFGFQPDETWLPVKKVLEKPVKPEILLAAISENIRKG